MTGARGGSAPAPGPLGREFFDRDVLQVARDLIGCTLLVDGVGGRIVEVEAYDQDEPAAHSHRGRSERNAVMFGPAGRVYVYRSYGLHWCMNLVCRDDRASAVLVRALEPTLGLAAMAERRGLDDPRLLCTGPGRLCQALGVTGAHDGARTDTPPFLLLGAPGAAHVATAPRIGITKAIELPWRFCERGSRFLSRPLPSGSAAR